MKTIDKIPKEIIEMYSIEQSDTILMIHKPNPIGIHLNDNVRVNDEEYGTTISTRGAIITLYKDVFSTHITIV